MPPGSAMSNVNGRLSIQYLAQADRTLLEKGTRARKDARHRPAAILAADAGWTPTLDAVDKVLHFTNVGPGKALGPGAENWRHQAVLAIGADHHCLSLHAADLHDPALAYVLNACVIAVVARANAGNAAQPAALEADVDQHVVVEVGGVHASRRPLEIGHLGVHSLEVRAHQPAHAVPVMAVDLRQHAIGGAQVTRPGRRQARPVGERLDHHWPADLAGLDALGCGGEFGIEAAHETELEDYARALRCAYDRVTLRQAQRHRLFEEDVFPRLRRLHRQRLMRERRRGNDDCLELRVVERGLQAAKSGLRLETELLCRSQPALGHGVYDGRQPCAGDVMGQ